MTDVLALVLPDTLRAVALAEGGIVFAMSLSEAYLYYVRKRDPRDPWFGVKRLDYMMFVRLGIALAAIMITVVVSGHLGDPELTYRAPGAVLTFTVMIYGMQGILRDDETIQDTGAAAGHRQHPGRRDTDQRA